jgi:hypothetical protein
MMGVARGVLGTSGPDIKTLVPPLAFFAPLVLSLSD